MKKLLFFALAGVALASCSDEEFVGDPIARSAGEITFSQAVPNATRGTQLEDDAAAAKLGGKFVVYGWKQGSTSTDRQVVFDNYTVEYGQSTANTTLSNTDDWEYVGKTSSPFTGGGITQSIKYWDFSYPEYVFMAWSISGGSAKIDGIQNGYSENYTTAYRDTALFFHASNAEDLAKIYVSDRENVKKAYFKNTTSNVVNLTFRNLAAKVRLGIYETVPGYSVKNVKFYPSADGTAGTTPYLFGTAGSANTIPTKGSVLVNYEYTAKAGYTGNKVAERPVVTTTASATTLSFQNGSALNYQTDKDYNEENTVKYVGRASNAATYPTTSEDGGYTYAFPHDALQLNLKVDYTLVSIDGKGETINVKGATAVVPTQYGQWEANHAYTYLFKISDKTNGSTGTTGDPEGLYPITFDACVVIEDTEHQETVTTVSTPTFTTYQDNINVTETDEYHQGYITVSLIDNSTKANIDLYPTGTNANVKLYSVISKDGTALTEANVANYANNGIILTDRTADLENPMNNGAAITTLVKFNAASGKVYAVEYTDPKTTKKYYKVIKVNVTSAPTATYTFSAYQESTCTNDLTEIDEGGSFWVKAYEGDDASKYPVTGAAAHFDDDTQDAFDIEETATAGTYKFTAKAVQTSGDEDILINSGDTKATVTVKAYEFASNSVTITAGTSGTITLNFNGSQANDVDANANFEITPNTGLSIKGTVTDGEVTIGAEKTATDGVIVYKNNNIVVASATITVQHYSFSFLNSNKSVLNIGSSVNADKETKVTMYLGGSSLAKSASVTVTTTAANVLNVDPATITTTDPQYGAVTLKAGSVTGTATVTAPDDNAVTITVVNLAATIYGIEANGSMGTTALATLTAGYEYYVKITDDGNTVTADLSGVVSTDNGSSTANGTLTPTSVKGIFKLSGVSAGTCQIKYKYDTNTTFTLATATVN